MTESEHSSDINEYLEKVRCEKIQKYKSEHHSSLTARDIMTRGVVTISQKGTIKDALDLFIKHGISSLVVLDHNKNSIGVFTETDLVHFDNQKSDSFFSIRDLKNIEVLQDKIGQIDETKLKNYQDEFIIDWMTPDLFTANTNNSLEEVCQVMIDNHIHRIFVEDSKKIVGVISSLDVVRIIAPRCEDNENDIDFYPHHAKNMKVDKPKGS